MTQVDFYLLPSKEQQDQLLFACKLAEKAYKKGHQIYLHTVSEEQTKQLDELLWSFSETSFIPHTAETEQSHLHPVFIDHSGEPRHMSDVMINLNPSTPLCFSRFERLAELVNDDEQVKQAGRERFKHYKRYGYPIKTHKL